MTAQIELDGDDAPWPTYPNGDDDCIFSDVDDEPTPPLRGDGNPAITIPPGAMRRIELEESVA